MVILSAMDESVRSFADGAAWMGGEIVPIGEARLPVTDWGLTHSDCVYDVVPVWEGGFFRLEAHLERFMASMARLRLEPPEGRDEIRTALIAMVARSRLRSAYCAMVCSRGRPARLGDRDPRNCANHFFAWCVPYVHVFGEDAADRGVRLWVARDVRRIPDDSVDPKAKSYHWGDFTAGLFEAKDAGHDSVVLLDHAGNVTEGPGFNVFAVTGGRLVTSGHGCLHGITRDTVIGLAREAGVEVETRPLPLAELMAADEVMACTSGGGPLPVTHVDAPTGAAVFANGAMGPVTARLRAAYWAAVMAPEHRTDIPFETQPA